MSTTNRVNVLHLISSTGMYGAEMWVLALARNFNREEVRCSLFTPVEQGQTMALCERFRALDLPVFFGPMRGKLDISVAFKICRAIRRNDIHILHTHGYKSDMIGLLAARLAGIPIISTPHGFENAKDKKLQLYIRMGCLALRFFDAVVPLSAELLSDMRRLGVKASRLRLIVNGVDLDEVEAAREAPDGQLPFDPALPAIAYSGQLIGRKNLPAMLTAFNLLSRERDDVQLVVIGEGKQRQSLEEMARSFPCRERIHFLGYRADRLQLLKACRLFTMTSSLEGIPRSMMEAMALGIPVAAFNIAGVDKLIVNGNTGLLAEFGDVDALTKCWSRILKEPAFARKLSEAGRDYILQNYSARRMASEYSELYMQILNGSRASSDLKQ